MALSSSLCSKGKASKFAAALVIGATLAVGLTFPALAFAEVKIDDTVINQGENAVGGGTATLADTVLDMVNVVANTMTTDQDLTVNYNGGNEIGEVYITDSADVTANFTGENNVEDFFIQDNASLTLNADGHNSFEEVEAQGDASVTINVTGENDFEEIGGIENASVTIRGTDCQMKDTINIEDSDTSLLVTVNGKLIIDHVTVNLKGAQTALVGALASDLVIDTSKIASDNDAVTLIGAAKTMLISESVIDIAGVVSSEGMMTINHSDVKVTKPKEDILSSPYRVYSSEGIQLIGEKNGKVVEGVYDGEKVFYVDTDDNEGTDVDLKADGEPGYYKCKTSTKGMPQTGDNTAALPMALLALASLTTTAYALRRRHDIAF